MGSGVTAVNYLHVFYDAISHFEISVPFHRSFLLPFDHYMIYKHRTKSVFWGKYIYMVTLYTYYFACYFRIAS